VQFPFLNLNYLFLKLSAFFGYIFSQHFLNLLYAVADIVVVLLITVILYSFVRIYEIQQAKKKAAAATTPLVPTSSLPASAPTAFSGGVKLPGAQSTTTVQPTTPRHNPTWEGIRAKILSENESDWRLGIIEADIYMDKVLIDQGYHGDTTSDKLKQISANALPSVQIAWEAHKVRNRIAHDGDAYVLTLPESRRVLSYFEIVFRDLGVIE
jgi:hypothetical protein